MKHESSMQSSGQLSGHSVGLPSNQNGQSALLPVLIMGSVAASHEEATSWSAALMDRLGSIRSEEPALRIHPILSGQPVLQWADRLLKALARQSRSQGDLESSRQFRELDRIFQWIDWPVESRFQRSMINRSFDWFGDYLDRRIHDEGMPCGAEKMALQQLMTLILVVDEIEKTRVPLGESVSLALVEECFRERIA